MGKASYITVLLAFPTTSFSLLGKACICLRTRFQGIWWLLFLLCPRLIHFFRLQLMQIWLHAVWGVFFNPCEVGHASGPSCTWMTRLADLVICLLCRRRRFPSSFCCHRRHVKPYVPSTFSRSFVTCKVPYLRVLDRWGSSIKPARSLR